MPIAVERTFTVTAPAATVLDHLADFGNARRCDPGTRHTTRNDAGPITVGANWHHVSRVLGLTTELTYTLCERTPHRLVFVGRNEDTTATDTVTVHPGAAGTVVTYHLHREMHGLAKLATPVLRAEFEKLAGRTAGNLTEVLNRLASQAR